MAENTNGHEQLFRSVQNGIDRFERFGKPFMTGFLTPFEKMQIGRIAAKAGGRFDGGYPDAVRCRFILDEAFDRPDPEEDGLYIPTGECCVMKAKLPASSSRVLKHSDVLGALMHSGLKRESIGDIAASPDALYLVCKSDLAEFIHQEIRLIARTPVEFEECDPLEMPKPVFEHLKINTASMRADCIVAALAHCSRADAKSLIAQGFVKVNDAILESAKVLCNNDTISVRRHGKFMIGELDGVSRKGRLIVNILKYQ